MLLWNLLHRPKCSAGPLWNPEKINWDRKFPLDPHGTRNAALEPDESPKSLTCTLQTPDMLSWNRHFPLEPHGAPKCFTGTF